MIAPAGGICPASPVWRAPTRVAPNPAAIAGRPRFTIDGSAALEAHLAATCEGILAGLRGLLPPRRLEAVLLGGGYGRGEGGVRMTPEGDRPYNDLEFYVCLRGNRHLNERRYHRALAVLGEILTPQAGVEVEFKITSVAELARSAISMFSYDLVAGHRWLLGSDALLSGCAHHYDAGGIPLGEATRLLMNRCSGLLLAAERLQRKIFTPGDADFIRRNIAKAELALGDAVLVTHGQYHAGCRERHHRLERIARAENTGWLREVADYHAVGVEFKLHPERGGATRESLQVSHDEVSLLAQKLWLQLESRRLGCAFATARIYAGSPLEKWPDAGRGKNLLRNLRAFGLRRALRRKTFRQPRERVCHALALLLWEPDVLRQPILLRHVQEELGTPATGFAEMVAAYCRLWERVK